MDANDIDNKLKLPDPGSGYCDLSATTVDQLCYWFVVVGICARCLRYFLRFPLWEDESFLCANYIFRDYAGLTQPLNYSPQSAPILYLWTQLCLVRLLGFHELTLRLVSFVASLGSLWFFGRIARGLLSGPPRVFAVALFAVAYPCIRYGAEASPFGVELFIGLAMTALAIKWMRRPDSRRAMCLLLGTLPFAYGYSQSAMLVGAGLSLAMAQYLWSQGFPLTLRQAGKPWRLWIGYSAAVIGCTLFFSVCGTLKLAATTASDDRFDASAGFPPVDHAAQWPLWLLEAHTGQMMGYPVGGPNFGGALTFALWLVGLAWLLWHRQWTFLTLGVAPLIVGLLASALKINPYGGHVKYNLYLAPWICMVASLGMTWLIAKAVRKLHRHWPVRLMIAGLTLVALVTMCRDFIWPYKSLGDFHARSFAQWFWYDLHQSGEVVCLKTDMNLDFSPDTYNKSNFSAEFLCNQSIYSPRHTAPLVSADKITREHPLRCILYRDPSVAFDEGAFQAWLDDMSAKYELSDCDKLPMIRKDHLERHVINESYVEVLHFVPRSALARADY